MFIEFIVTKMEVEDLSSEMVSSPQSETVWQDKEVNGDEHILLDKSIEVENSSLKTLTSESSELGNITTENGKKRVKEEKPPSKIVVRRLPPTMIKDSFIELVSPLPDVDYLYYVHGEVNNSINPYSRAYLNFVNQEDLFSFSRTFDNYVFLDNKGQEYPAVVEFAMFQRTPKLRLKKRDNSVARIEDDSTYIEFKENLQAEALENSKPGGKAMKQHYFETEISAAEEINTTPLLEFIKVRRAEKSRIREERREEKKRKEIERKTKLKTKDKKGDGDEEEQPPKEVKIQDKISDKVEDSIVESKKQMAIVEKLGKNKIVDCQKLSKSKTVVPYKNQEQKISILINPESKNSSKEKDKPSSVCEVRSNTHTVTSLPVSRTKCDKLLSINSKLGNLVKQVEAQKIKEAEQQTMCLRKMLGLLPAVGNMLLKNEEVSGNVIDRSSCEPVRIRDQLKKVEPPEEVLSAFKEYINVNRKKEILWSRHNINPALPSASFRTSNSLALTNSTETGPEQRSMSAPRESHDTLGSNEKSHVSRFSRMDVKCSSSTPNVSLNPSETGGSSRFSRPLIRRNSLQSSTEISEEDEEVLQPREKREVNKDRESRSIRKKDEKEKSIKETRGKEFKGRGGKSYQEERMKLAERREEQKRRELLKDTSKTPDGGGGNDLIESLEANNEQAKLPTEEKNSRTEKKKYEYRKKYDNDDLKDEKKKNRNDKNNMKRDVRDRRDEYTRRDKKGGDADTRRRTNKPYKNLEFPKNTNDKRKSSPLNVPDAKSVSQEPKKNLKLDKETIETSKEKWKSVDDLTLLLMKDRKEKTVVPDITNTLISNKSRCSSLENVRSELKPLDDSVKLRIDEVIAKKQPKAESKGTSQNSDGRSKRDLSTKNTASPRKSGTSKKSETSDDKKADNDFSEPPQKIDKNKGATDGDTNAKRREAARAERRIRNKDRPSIEIYRPGMGKFSKQRLEKEKALGSSTEIESPSHSPSPTPKSKLIS